MNLDELKAKNKAEDETQVKTEDKKPVTEETTETIVDPEQNEEVSEGEEIPAFLDTGEQTPEEEDGNDYVPLKTFKSKINKFKGEIKDKDEENERLRAERDELRNKTYKPEELKRPLKEDFDTDEEFYVADDAYIDARSTDNFRRLNHQDTQKSKQAETLNNINKGVDDHYDRVEKLCEKHKIKPETYKEAESKFRNVVEMAYPKNGELISNAMINDIGKGSEAVVMHLGVNENARNRLHTLLSQDPNGIKAAIYFGELNAKLNKSGKRVSNARSPATDIKGDASNNAGGAEKRKYDAAHAKGDVQSAIDIKSAAKSNGADTSSW